MDASIDMPVDTSDVSDLATTAMESALDLATDLAAPAVKAGLVRFALRRRRTIVLVVVAAVIAPLVMKKLRDRKNDSTPSVPTKSEQTVTEMPNVERRTTTDA